MSFRYSLSAWLGPILIDMSIGDNEIVYIQRLFWPCRVALQ
jgi:hypothetical protein